MILHLGAECFVPLSEVVAILHLDSPLRAGTRRFLEAARKRRQVRQVPEGEPKSMVVAVDAHMHCRVFLSPISSQTLLARCACGPAGERRDKRGVLCNT